MAPKKYTHPLGREAKYLFTDNDKDKNIWGVYDVTPPVGYPYVRVNQAIKEQDLLALGFIEAPTDTEEKVDWIDDAFEDTGLEHMHKWATNQEETDKLKAVLKKCLLHHMPKPVEQELVPLDVEAIVKEYETRDNITWGVTGGELRIILSKYGVHKQGEKKPDITKVTREQIDNWCDRCCGVVPQYVENAKNAIKCFIKFQTSSYRDTPTPQATSVDVESMCKMVFDDVIKQVHSMGVVLPQLPKREPLQIIIQNSVLRNKVQATSVDDLVHKIYIKLYNSGLKLDDTQQQFIKEVLLSSLPIQKKRSQNDIKYYVGLMGAMGRDEVDKNNAIKIIKGFLDWHKIYQD